MSAQLVGRFTGSTPLRVAAGGRGWRGGITVTRLARRCLAVSRHHWAAAVRCEES